MTHRFDVKICGLKDEASIRCAIDVGADYIGFVFYPPSPRAVSLEKARQLSILLPRHIDLVAVTVDADDALLEAIIEACHPHLLQLHGSEPADRCAVLKRRYPEMEIVKAFSVSDSSDLHKILPYVDHVDRVLFDAKPPKDATLPGGNGIAFDWSILRGAGIPRPWFLSGGLTIENVEEAIAISGARAVDVSSGVEESPGVKSIEAIKAFIEKVQAASRPSDDKKAHV